jgi:general secretion pathway protein A
MIELLSSQEYKGTFESYFGFRETPFGVTPDPRFFYSSPPYLEGLAAFVYGIRAKKGFMLLTGEVGTGKTILLRKLMRQLQSTVQFVFISSSHITSYGLVELMVHDLGLPNKEKNRLDLIQELNSYLIQQLQKGQAVALLIDEGQNLSDEALEGLCGLSNLETDEEKLLQIVLVGQPELANKLTKPSLRRLKQRVAIHHRLYSLQSVGEVEDYIRHRLQVAGYEGPEIFHKEAVETVWYYSAGTPRLINIICDNGLAMACELGKRKVSPYMIMKAAGALLLERGHELPKIGVSDNGASRSRAQAARSIPKKIETPGFEAKKAPDESSVSAQETEPVAGFQAELQAPPVAPEFFDYLTRAATAAMGPMAALVLRDQISALGESRDTFPHPKLRELVELVSREILNETMRNYFQEMMFDEIDALDRFRAA